MRRSLSCLILSAASVLSVCALGTNAPAAQPESSVTYQASSTCPAASAFFQELKKRSTQMPDSGTASINVHIDVASTTSPELEKGQLFVGTMTLTARGQAPVQRRVQAPACTEVMSAMTIVVALAIDAVVAHRALPAEAPPAKATPSKAPPVEVQTRPLPPLPAREAEVARKSDANTSPPASTASRKSPPPTHPRPIHWQLLLGAGGGGGSLLPAPAWGALAFVELGSRMLQGRISGGYRLNTEVRRGAQSYRVALLSGQSELCMRQRFSERFGVQPCAAVELGELEGEAQQGFRTSAPPQRSVWAAAGVLARANYKISSRLTWELEAGLVFPLVSRLRLEAQTADNTTKELYAPPLAGLRLATGLAWKVF